MAHPIHEANESSPYGNLTREKFYERNGISHEESFMLNHQSLKIFTQTWQPQSKPTALIAMIHGYTSQSSWLFELNAVAFAKSGFLVCALDLQGHGLSQGPSDHMPDLQPLIKDCAQYFDSIRSRHPDLPHFLYGESLGGAIALVLCLHHNDIMIRPWRGLVLSGSMCRITKKMRLWPLDKLTKIAALIAPTWRPGFVRPPASLSYRQDWKRKLAKRSPNRRSCGRPTLASIVEIFKVCDYIKKKCGAISVPMLVLHGEKDAVCDPEGAKHLYKMAASTDKTLMIYPGMWHLMIGEDNQRVEDIFATMVKWIHLRAAADPPNNPPAC